MFYPSPPSSLHQLSFPWRRFGWFFLLLRSAQTLSAKSIFNPFFALFVFSNHAFCVLNFCLDSAHGANRVMLGNLIIHVGIVSNWNCFFLRCKKGFKLKLLPPSVARCWSFSFSLCWFWWIENWKKGEVKKKDGAECDWHESWLKFSVS